MIDFCQKSTDLNTLVFIQNEYGAKNKFIQSLVRVVNPISCVTTFESDMIKWAKIFLKEKYSATDFLEPITKRELNNKIRIGYYSADFCNHAVSHLLVKLFELHDKSKFELFGFSFGPEKNDEMRKRVSSAFDLFINVNL